MDEFVTKLCVGAARTGELPIHHILGRRRLLNSMAVLGLGGVVVGLFAEPRPASAQQNCGDCTCTFTQTTGCGWCDPCNVRNFGCASTCQETCHEAKRTIYYDCCLGNVCSDTGCQETIRSSGCCQPCV